MKRMFASSIATLILLAGVCLPVTESVALAAQKRSPSTEQRRARRTAEQPAMRPRVADRSYRQYSSAKDSQQTRPRSVRRNRGDYSPRQGEGVASVEILGPVYTTYTVPTNQYFRLRVNQSISSANVRRGDLFETTVVTPIYVGGVEVVPAGSVVDGRVTSVKSARSKGREGQLAISFNTLILPDGTAHRIDGVLTEIEDATAQIDNNNEVSGRPSDTRKIVFIGGGTAGGAVIGGAIGGRKGAAIGAIIGAGAGVAGAMITKGNEAVIDSGTEMGMLITQPVEITLRSGR